MADKLKLFISYSHIDKNEKERLQVHLANLERTNNIEVWADHMIVAGQEWEPAIFNKLRASQLILLLISPDFIASNYAYEKEMGEAIALHENKKVMVIPIMLKSVMEAGHPFSRLQTLPTNPRYLSDWPDQDAGFTDIIRGLAQSVDLFIKDILSRDILYREQEVLDYVIAGEILNAIDRLLDFATEFSEGNEYRRKALAIKGAYKSVEGKKEQIALNTIEVNEQILILIDTIKGSPHNA